jgi:protein-S-isoprenylcysteine O-methyltransferase Ste14
VVTSVVLIEMITIYAVSKDSGIWKTILATLGGSNLKPSDLSMSPLFFLGVVTTVSAAWLRLACYREMKAMFTFQVTLRDNHKLIKSGPYAFVRHPGYTALVLLMAGLSFIELSSGSWWSTSMPYRSTILGNSLVLAWSYAIVQFLFVCARAPEEDKLLKGKFGKEWEEYAAEVPFRFVPGIICRLYL